MFSYLKKRLAISNRASERRIAREKPRGRSRLGLEALEDRQLLSGFAAMPNGPADPGHFTLVGTAGSSNDTFEIDAPPPGALTPPTVKFDGVPYSGVSMSLVDHIIFEGAGFKPKAILDVKGAGQTLLHPEGYDLRLFGDHGYLLEKTYDLKINGIPDIIANGDAEGVIRLYGSKSTPNTFLETPTSSTMVNAMSFDQANGFGIAYGFAGDSYGYAFGTHQDRAILRGSELYQSHFVLGAQGTPGISTYGAILFNTSGLLPYGVGFHYVDAYAGTSSDIGDFRGSKQLASTYTSHGVNSDGMTYSVLTADNESYSFEAFGCFQTGALAGTKRDVAYLYGSTTSPNKLTIALAQPPGIIDVHLVSNVHYDETYGFLRVSAYARTAGDTVNVQAGSSQMLPPPPPHTSYLRVKGSSFGGHFEVDAYDFS
jgi:hypothetical protein